MSWYAADTGNYQGLIIDEETGENVAVCYDKKNAALIAAAPELLEALGEMEKVESSPHSETVRFMAREKARDILSKVKGE